MRGGGGWGKPPTPSAAKRATLPPTAWTGERKHGGSRAVRAVRVAHAAADRGIHGGDRVGRRDLRVRLLQRRPPGATEVFLEPADSLGANPFIDLLRSPVPTVVLARDLLPDDAK